MSGVARRRRRDRRGRGYTAVEVLMAMTVMAIGAAAVMTMQKASVQGNLDARKTDIANAIARTWVERIQRDAMLWTIPGPMNPNGTPNLALAKVLEFGVVSAPNGWFRPDMYASDTVPLSPGFDILGRDLPFTNLSDAIFCVNVRLSPLDTTSLMRVDVRVLWLRGLLTKASESAQFFSVCDSTLAKSLSPDPNLYHALYVTTAVQGNPQ